MAKSSSRASSAACCRIWPTCRCSSCARRRPHREASSSFPEEIAMKAMLFSLSLVLLALVPPAVRAQEPQTSETPQTTDQKLEELDQKIRVLDRKIELDKEAAAEKAKTAGGVTADKSGFSIKSADGAYRLRIGGHAQLDNRLFLDEKQRSTVDTFILRLVR